MKKLKSPIVLNKTVDFDTFKKYVEILKNLGVKTPWEQAPSLFEGRKNTKDFYNFYSAEFPFLSIHSGASNIIYWNLFKKSGTCNSFEDMLFALVEPEFTPVNVILNTEHLAIIERDCVKVGCQKFSFESIANLAKEVEKVKKLTE